MVAELLARELWRQNELWRKRNMMADDGWIYPYDWLIKPTRDELLSYAEGLLETLEAAGWELVPPKAEDPSEGLRTPLEDPLAQAGSADYA